MPELPEIEHLRRSLSPYLIGARVQRARLHRGDVLTIETKRDRSVRRSLLEGTIIDRLERRGKQLAIIARDDRTLCVHLGMSGRLQWHETGAAIEPADHIHARWLIGSCNGTGELVFRDPRRFGGLWSFANIQDLHDHRWNELGPDALETTTDALCNHLRDAFARTNRSLKAVLLDQSVLAGIGNIYADEICHRARIHPASDAGAVVHQRLLKRLVDSVSYILTAAVERGGSTFRDYVDADGRRGEAVSLHRVYGRAGEPCLTCGTPLDQAVLAQRTTTWCGRCQLLLSGSIARPVVHKSFPSAVENRSGSRRRRRKVSV